MLTKFEEIDKAEVESIALTEYINFKNENPDCVLLFQIGSFYETLFEDAKTFSEITGTALGMRNFKPKIQVAESGIPVGALNIYIRKLLNNGLKVCVCSEFKDEYGSYYREVTRKYTQGTILEDELLDSYENNYIMTLYFSEDVYNIAYADVSTGQIYKTKGNYREYRAEIDKILPKEVLISNSQEKLFKDIILKYNTTILDDKYFEDKFEDSIEKYCKYTQKKYKIKFDKITEYQCSSYMMLDEATRKNLELTRTNYLSKRKGSILWFLNYTKTPMGTRLLKRFLSEPLFSKEDILMRLDAVEELVKQPSIINSIQDSLNQFSDILRLCSKLSNVTILPKDLLNFSRNILLLKDLKDIIENLNSKLFKIDSIKLNKVLDFANMIDIAIKKDCSNELKAGNIINDKYNPELDFLRSELKNLSDEVEKYCKLQKKKLGIDNLKINYLSAAGYCIEIPAKYNLKVPKEYFKKNSTTQIVRYSTNELVNLQENINSLKYKINELEYEIYKKIRTQACKFVELIRSLAKEVALIDVISSFAKSAVENNLVKPEIIGEDLIIKDGYHPSLIKLNNEIIKNDINLNQGSMIILTGANMSGKSTYLKFNAIICILAQIGSFVPAQFAKVPLIDKIFFYQASSDDIINNNSSFMVEMNDLKCILENATNSSLILLDEPAKSTNAKESGAIARAFCEYIIKKYKLKAIVATHNLELAKLEQDYPSNVQNYVIGSNNFDNVIKDRKIRRGIVNENYAINTATLAQLPQEILQIANKYILADK